jgi:hypothetical protein
MLGKKTDNAAFCHEKIVCTAFGFNVFWRRELFCASSVKGKYRCDSNFAIFESQRYLPLMGERLNVD